MNFLRKDFKEEARIARRRQFEEQRKPRIFDPKTRLIGVDVHGLDQQRHEKQVLAEAAKRNDDVYTRKRIEGDKVCIELERQLDIQKRRLAKEIREFQEEYQHPASRREFDLNDPDLKKKLKYTDDISFEGEDPNRNQRMKEQKRQNRAWLLQQIDEKRRIEQDLKNITEEMTRRHGAYNERAKRLADLEEKCRKKIDEATAEFNKLSASERQEIDREETHKQTKIEAREIENWVRRHQEEKNQKTWEDYHEAMYRQAFEKECDLMKEQRRLNERIVQANCQIAHHHSVKEAERNNIRDLRPTSKFFDQFNRTTY